ncbi:hypothetical protein [Photobacterium galatheae]|uniref:Phage protein n=1 Tax=Photobacterium galatheae TaxID=1654360 RepID=A0A066RR18_9GAMM|nr:hypothetical protein [Photobacterium galatheae]KDM92895.1 hypothetical protein EA58_03830 [Photobacterium galatheae]MCM0148140.1 hypothetical protein [Photobacterium galatheae]
MSDGIHLNDYHQAVKTWLSENLSWLKTIEHYPETQTALKTPCVFFGVMDWERSDNQPMNGQLAVTLNCEILAVLGMADAQYQLEVRNAAMAIGLAIEQSRFGLPVDPAVFVSAEPDGFNPELDEYAVWSIRFNQDVEIGQDVYQPEGLTPHTVHVGYSPDIGPANTDKYEQVVGDE